MDSGAVGNETPQSIHQKGAQYRMIDVASDEHWIILAGSFGVSFLLRL
jgi:hypothetical protein